MKKIIITLLILQTFWAIKALAGAEEIVITGSRITRSDMYEMPAVTLTKSADYLIQKIRLINDSRSPALRKKEIIDTLNNLIDGAKRAKGIELSYGSGFLMPINLNDDSLQLIEDRKRADTNYVDIYVKVSVDSSQTPKHQIAELRSFIKNAKLISRTEIDVLGDVGLSIVDPDQYRYHLLEKIAKENKKLREIMGQKCEMILDGLEGRVEWERTGVVELTLYIGFGSSVSCK